MLLKTVTWVGDGEVDVELQNYSAGECSALFIERNGFLLKAVHVWGEDHGGSHQDEREETSYEEILPERMLVRDGHFCGVMISCEYDYRNGSGRHSYEDAVLWCDPAAAPIGKARDGAYYSDDDHCRWNYVDYSLVGRDESEK